jgi:hypothetical protein
MYNPPYSIHYVGIIMLKRHADQVWNRLDQLYANGTTFISYGDLYHWYNVQKIKKTPWRDIQRRWEELLEEKDEEYADPQIAETGGGISFFFSLNPSTLSKKAE